jgi:molecular chaperone DnaJ
MAEHGGVSTFGFEGFDFTISVHGTEAPTFGDLFADVLHQREARREEGTPERGVDLHQAVMLEFEEAMRGGQRLLTLTRQERCRTCQGIGRLHVDETRCLQCHGAGVVKSARGHMVFSKPCAPCGGTGRQRQSLCPICSGQQVEMRTESVTISVPPGLADGARIRVPGKGHVGRNGGETGDLYITVHVRPHPLFQRDGDDLHLTVPVAIHEAALGAKIDVPSIDGPARLRVPPGTQSGQRFRVRERGVPSPRDGRRGDLVVEVKLVLPRLLDERSKELLREFGRINADDVRDALLHKGHEGYEGHKGRS